VANFILVFPDGRREEMTGPRVSEKGSILTGGVVSYVSRPYGKEPVVYLDPIGTGLAKMTTFVVDGAPFLLSLGEAAELGDRLRLLAGGSLESSSTSVAVRIEQLLEEAIGESPAADFLESEKSALRAAIDEWLLEVGAANLPDRVMDLRYALHGEAQGPRAVD
jgi:hypothetical protein